LVRAPSSLKKVLLKDALWWRFHQTYQPSIRDVVVDNVSRVLACGSSDLGCATFQCSNPHCSHEHRVPFTCKSRFCPSCGKKRTDQWIAQQLEVLPHTEWQHITFTMPGELWELFARNRMLLGQLSRLTAQTLTALTKKKGITPGIFTALHTFGRDLKWNVHVHVSVTRGGVNHDQTQWRNFYFAKQAIMPQWRYAVINLLRQAHNEGILNKPKALEDIQAWAQFLRTHYNKSWIVHFAKASKKPLHNIRYLGRYIARPPLAMSRLKHYDGSTVIFRYLDHYDGQQRLFRCSGFAFIARLVRHIPDKGFRMIRYYGFLANRVRGKLLPIVRKLLGQDADPLHAPKLRYADMLKNAFGIDPLVCILCQSTMQLVGITLGIPLKHLINHHQKLALGRPLAWPL